MNQLKILPTTVKELEEKPGLKERVDHLGFLKDRITQTEAELRASAKAIELAEIMEEFSALEAEIQADLVKGVGNDHAITVPGKTWNYEMSACANRRTVAHPEKVFEFLKPAELAAITSFKLGDLDKYLTPTQVDQVLESEQTGARRFKLKVRV